MEKLTAVEVRVAGALVEKALTTPEYYPLSLNALVAACNQKTGRDPVMELSEADVRHALERLVRIRLVGTTDGGRVTKYRHLFASRLNLHEPQQAMLALLMLRGPQTAGELRTRSERMYPSDHIERIERILEDLINHADPLVVRLPTLPGQSAPRYLHLLQEGLDAETVAKQQGPLRPAVIEDSRLAKLEEEVQTLKLELASLRDAFEFLRTQLGAA